MTELLLAEIDMLKKKIDHIRDICEEAITFEDTVEIETEIKKVIDICDNKCCNNCRWWQKEDISDGHICTNSLSDHCADWTDKNHTCKKFESKEGV